MKQASVLQLELLGASQQPKSSLTFGSKRISDFILNILENEIDIYRVEHGFALDIPELESRQYKEFKGVIASLRGKWTGKTHLFDYDPTNLLKEVIEAGRIPKTNPYHFFETQEGEIDDLFTLLDLPEGDEWELSLLEPSCGRGAIAQKLRARLPNSSLDVVEIDPLNQEKLRLDGFNLTGSDFLKANTSKRYDFIVTNPPFNGLEYIDHIEKQFSLLKPYGRIGAIAPEGLLTGSSKRVVEFRNFVAERGHWEFIGAPFKDTPTKCIALSLENLSFSEIQSRWEPVNGYESRFHESTEIMLDCDQRWLNILGCARKRSEEEQEQLLGNALDQRVNQFIGKGHECFLYNQRVKDQLLRSAIASLKFDY